MSAKRDDSVIVIGDRVELMRDRDHAYKTKIEDIYAGGAYLVGVPSLGRVTMALSRYDDLFMAFSRESGRYVVPVRVMDVRITDGIRYALLMKKTEPRRDQRREAFRVPVRIRVLIYDKPRSPAAQRQSVPSRDAQDGEAAGPEPLLDEIPAVEQGGQPLLESTGSRDISLTGIALTTGKAYPNGSDYVLKLHLGDPQHGDPRRGDPRQGTAHYVRARVVRSMPGIRRNTFDIGMRFVDQPKNMSATLSRYLFAQQQKQLRAEGNKESDND